MAHLGRFRWDFVYLKESKPAVSGLVNESAFICDRKFIQQLYTNTTVIIIIINIIAVYII